MKKPNRSTTIFTILARPFVVLRYSLVFSFAQDRMFSCARSTLLLLLFTAVHAAPRGRLANLCDGNGQPEPLKVKETLVHRTDLSKRFSRPQYINVTVTDTDSQFQSTPADPTGVPNGLPKSQECSFSSTFASQVCEWVYRCDTDEQRIPQHLIHAELTERASQRPVFMLHETRRWVDCSCQPITAPINVLKFHDCAAEKEEWRWETVQVTVAFVCARHI